MPSTSSSPRSSKEPAHSPLGPSGSKRWLECTASVGFIEANRAVLPSDGGSSRYADEGTEAHAFAQHLFGRPKKIERPRNTEMVALIEEGYVPFCEAEAKKLGLKRVPSEIVVPLFYDRSQKGTCDVPMLGPAKIVVADLKYGPGIEVEAVNNTQLVIYAESAIRESGRKYPPKTPVELIIYQPRSPSNRFVKRWVLTRGELAEIGNRIRDVAHSIIMDPDDQTFKADAETTCRWCPAKPICSHYAAHLLDEVPEPVAKQLSSVESRLSLTPPNKLSDSQLVRLLRVRKDLEEWFSMIDEYLVRRMLKGTKYDGLKVVAGKSRRKWTDEAAAAKLLLSLFPREKVYPSELLSPSAAGDLIKGLKRKPDPRFLDRVAKLITKPEGKPSIAPKDDPRPPLEIVDLRSELL